MPQEGCFDNEAFPLLFLVSDLAHIMEIFCAEQGLLFLVAGG
jgi:hypothetical protein